MIRTLLRLLPNGSGNKVAWLVTLTVIGVLVRAAGVVVLVPLLQELFGPRPVAAWPWAGVLVAVTAAGWIIDTITARVGFGLGFGLLSTGQRTVADSLMRIRLSWFTGQHMGDARQAVAATGPDLVRLIVNLVTPLMNSVLLPIAIALALLPISAPLGLAALAGVPILLAAYWLSGHLTRAADHAVTQSSSVLSARIVEFARTQQALRAARRVEPARSHAGSALAAQNGATLRLLLLQVPGQLLFGLASQLALLLLAGTTVVLTVRGELSAPTAIALIVVIVRYLEPFTALAELSQAIEPTTAMLRKVQAVLDAAGPEGSAQTVSTGEAVAGAADVSGPSSTAAQNADVDGSGAQAGPPRLGLSNVTFGYADTAAGPVLSGFSLDLQPGSTTAIVGPSGSGKSTVLQLLAGLREPDTGAVLVDGIDMTRLRTDTRQDLVSVVFQEPYLFDETVRENVLVGNTTARREDFANAADLARVDSVITRLPDGWDTRVGEAGTALSGGERQRVSIARALLKPAPVLLVDEATSALDTENGAAVTAALTDDPVARTRVIVAHQLASIRNADRVVFLDHGRIVEDGTVEDLLASGGRFAQFWQQQDAAADWQLGG